VSDFYRTNMGHRFYEGTMPALVEQLKRLNDNLERLIARDKPIEKNEPTPQR
jgi:hypothetical protein